MNRVQHPLVQRGLSDDDGAEVHPQGLFVKGSLIHPGDSVDVEAHQVPIILQVLQGFHLSPSPVHRADHFDGFHLPGIPQVQISEPVGILMQGGEEEQTPVPRREMAGMDGVRRNLFPLGAFLQRFSVKQGKPFPFLPQIEDVISQRVAVQQDGLRVVGVHPGNEGIPFAFAQLLQGSRIQPAAPGDTEGLGPGFGVQVDDVSFRIALRHMDAPSVEGIAEGRFRKPPIQGNEHGLVILIPVPVDHHQDLVQFRKNGVRLSPDQGRVLQGDVGGQEGFGYAPFFVHRVQAKATAQIAEKVEAIAHLPGPQEQTGGKQRFNASHDPFYKTSRMYDGR